MQTIINYINLTCGIEWIPELESRYNESCRFIRIQSTWCEQKLWNEILLDLDYDFLFNLAIGNIVSVYDCSAHKKTSRALYQGLEWIKFVLYKRWYNEEYIPIVNGTNCTKYFQDNYKKLDKKTKKKIDYFKPFVSGYFSLNGFCKTSTLDGHVKNFKPIIERCINGTES